MSATTVLHEGTPDEVGMDPKRVQLARDLLRSHVDDGQTPTLVALVARRGVIVLTEALGTRGPGLGPVELDSLFAIASNSKPITATLVMSLAEDGLLGINRSVVDYLPELAAGDNNRVLVHHLLTHTSGFDDDTVGAMMGERLKKGELTPPPADLHPWVHLQLSTAWDAPRSKGVGREMIYCSHNYNLLGEIVRRVSGEPIDTFARRRLFEPLGMCNAAYALDEGQRERFVHRAPDVPLGAPDPATANPGFEDPLFATYDGGGGGAKASAPDLATFVQMFLNRGIYNGTRVLSRAAVAAMTRNQTPGIPVDIFGQWHAESGYTYGWLTDTGQRFAYHHGSLQPPGTMSHGGSGGSQMFFDPSNDLIGVVLEVATNLSDDGEPLSGIFERFQNVVYSAIED